MRIYGMVSKGTRTILKMTTQDDILIACTVGDLSWLRRCLCGTRDITKIRNSEGMNPLHLVALHGRYDCLNYLLNNCSAAVDAVVTSTGSTALHCSVSKKIGTRSLQCMKLLLDRGASQNMQNKYGQTALHHAAKTGHAKCVKCLLEHKADVSIKDKDGHTALDLACRYGHYESARLLRALLWASKKDQGTQEKIQVKSLEQKQQLEQSRAKQAIRSEAAKKAYSDWLRSKNITEVPQRASRSSTPDPISAKVVDQKLTKRTNVSLHQVKRNVKDVGVPEKQFPYSNYRPESSSGSARKASAKSRASRRSSSTKSAKSTATRTENKDDEMSVAESKVEHTEQEVNEASALTEEDIKSDDSEYDFFHEVGQENDLHSLSLPSSLTSGKTPAEVLTMLRSLGESNGYSRLNHKHISYRHKFNRRLSLGAIPEGQIVKDYFATDDQVYETLMMGYRGLESSAQDDREAEQLQTDDREFPQPTKTESWFEQFPLHRRRNLSVPTNLCLYAKEETATPAQSLKVVNLAWDSEKKTVSSLVTISPIAPHPSTTRNTMPMGKTSSPSPKHTSNSELLEVTSIERLTPHQYQKGRRSPDGISSASSDHSVQSEQTPPPKISPFDLSSKSVMSLSSLMPPPLALNKTRRAKSAPRLTALPAMQSNTSKQRVLKSAVLQFGGTLTHSL